MLEMNYLYSERLDSGALKGRGHKSIKNSYQRFPAPLQSRLKPFVSQNIFWQVFFVGALRLESFAFADPISWVAAGMIIGGVAGCALLAAIIPIARNWFVQDQCGTRRQHS